MIDVQQRSLRTFEEQVATSGMVHRAAGSPHPPSMGLKDLGRLHALPGIEAKARVRFPGSQWRRHTL